MHTISELIVNYRLLRGHSQDELTQKLGYANKSSLVSYEKGNTFPSLNVIRKIRLVLNIPKKELMDILFPETLEVDNEA